MQKIDLCNYANDSTLYAAENSFSVLLDNLKKRFLVSFMAITVF